MVNGNPDKYQVVLRHRNSDWYKKVWIPAISASLGGYPHLIKHCGELYEYDRSWQLEGLPCYVRIRSWPAFTTSANVDIWRLIEDE